MEKWKRKKKKLCKKYAKSKRQSHTRTLIGICKLTAQYIVLVINALDNL